MLFRMLFSLDVIKLRYNSGKLYSGTTALGHQAKAQSVKVIESPHEAFAHIDHWRREGLRIGLIPTMGALHAGHFSLVRRSVAGCDITTASIFVNPTQFAPQEDLSRYPRTLESDLEGLRASKCDLVFVPQPSALYPDGFSTYVQPPAAAEPLEGVCRPGHFRGVCTIVLKLFGIMPAHVAYFGRKDYQQLLVIKRMTEDLNVPIHIEGCPTVREDDGLAMSSRNRYLSPQQRSAALSLRKALQAAQDLANTGLISIDLLETAMRSKMMETGADDVEYARIVDSESLANLTLLDQPAIALVAAKVGTTRLIDNLEITPPPG